MTNTITHEGVEYRKVERKAEIGELIFVTSGVNWYDDKIGEVFSVIEPTKYGFRDTGYAYVDYKPSRNQLYFVSEENYVVLEPIESEPTPVEASPTVIELLANISRRLYEAEQTIKEQAYEINELYKAVAERG